MADVSFLPFSILSRLTVLHEIMQKKAETKSEEEKQLLSGIMETSFLLKESATAVKSALGLADAQAFAPVMRSLGTAAGAFGIIGSFASVGENVVKNEEIGERKDALHMKADVERMESLKNEDIGGGVEKEELIAALHLSQNIVGLEKAFAQFDLGISMLEMGLSVADMVTGVSPLAIVSASLKIMLIITKKIKTAVEHSKKRKNQRKFVSERFENMMKEIRNDPAFQNLSERDIKHVVLRHVGVDSGTRIEAALRGLTIFNSKMVKKREEERQEENRQIYLDMHSIDKTKSEREQMKELLKRGGFTKEEVEDPMRAVNQRMNEKRKRFGKKKHSFGVFNWW